MSYSILSPGCESAAVTLPGGYQYDEVTIDYTLRLRSGQAYDPLYRLTAADYVSTGSTQRSTGDYYHYTYDAVGNRLTQESMIEGLTSNIAYQYDDANRLVDVNGVPYTLRLRSGQAWDANGNLLSDGVNTYAYDSANRLIAVSREQGVESSYTYNGLGDRLSQNGVNYTLDLNSGLTQVLSDGSTTYTYGIGRISQQNGSTTEYFLGDALGSVRQLTNAAGQVTLVKSYEPYGSVVSSAGSGASVFGYTGEQQRQSCLASHGRDHLA